MSSLRIAVVGCGRIARMAHLPALRKIEGAQVVALCDASAAQMREAARFFPEAALVDDYRVLLRDAGLDAVVIALPTHLHAPVAIASFQAGKHVYLEKPLALNEAEARALVDAETASGRIGMIGFNFRFHPAYLALRDQVKSGRVGRIAGVRTAFCSAPRDLPEWKLSRATGGSALMDLASHHIDLVSFVLGQEVIDVHSSSRSLRSEADTSLIDMWLADGTPVQTFVSMSAAQEDCFEVRGERGVLTVDRYAPRAEVQFRPARRAGSLTDRATAAIRIGLETPGRMFSALKSSEERSYAASLAAFVNAARSGAPSPIPLSEGARGLAVVRAAEESARTGGTIAVGTLARSDHDRSGLAGAMQSMQWSRKADLSRISVVVVSPDNFGTIRRTVRHLSDQTVRSRIELILVAPTIEGLRERASADIHGFNNVIEIAVGPIENVDKAAVHGIGRATCDIVALVEDHAYPEPEWAAALLEAHTGPWAAVGSVVVNANPDTALSWTNLLLAYGSWVEPVDVGETRSVSRHNISFKKAALAAFGGDLEAMMGRDGGLLQKMLARGDRFFLEGGARIRHANPSLLSSTIELRVNGGRIAAATRARLEKWSLARRLLYAVAAPVFPVLRARPLRDKIFAPAVFPRAFPSIALGLVLDGVGQAMGFLLGPGDTAQKLADFEVDRLRHVTPADRELLAR